MHCTSLLRYVCIPLLGTILQGVPCSTPKTIAEIRGLYKYIVIHNLICNFRTFQGKTVDGNVLNGLLKTEGLIISTSPYMQ